MEWVSKLPLYLQVFLASAVGTAFIGFIFKVGEMVVQNSIDRSNDTYKDKRELAKAVITICIEGQSTSFTSFPRNIEHLYYIAELVRAESEETGKDMNKLLSTWQVCASRHQGKTYLSSEEVEFVTDLQHEGRKICDKLLKTAHKWKK